jgi:GTP cyclohydrolase III
MALVHQNSCECTKSELDLLGVPPTQTSVEHGYWELTSTLTDQGPYEFAVSGAGDNYIDLFNTYLFVEAITMVLTISYIRKSVGVLEPFLTEDVFRCVP